MKTETMYQIRTTKRFRKSLKRFAHDKKLLAEVEHCTKFLLRGTPIPAHYRDHRLSGSLAEYRELHIRPDTLLIYKKYEYDLVLVLVDVGSHAKLFKS